MARRVPAAVPGGPGGGSRWRPRWQFPAVVPGDPRLRQRIPAGSGGSSPAAAVYKSASLELRPLEARELTAILCFVSLAHTHAVCLFQGNCGRIVVVLAAVNAGANPCAQICLDLFLLRLKPAIVGHRV